MEEARRNLLEFKPNRHHCMIQGQAVILTCSTGMLGSCISDSFLSELPAPRVHFLNRVDDDDFEKQGKINI
jgi:hypothetical protein